MVTSSLDGITSRSSASKMGKGFGFEMTSSRIVSNPSPTESAIESGYVFATSGGPMTYSKVGGASTSGAFSASTTNVGFVAFPAELPSSVTLKTHDESAGTKPLRRLTNCPTTMAFTQPEEAAPMVSTDTLTGTTVLGSPSSNCTPVMLANELTLEMVIILNVVSPILMDGSST